MLRFLTAGESHGPALVVVVEGLPAGLPITIDEIAAELARRRLGFGRGPRMRFERDDVEFVGGVRHGATLGSPVSLVIHNTEWPKWQEEMSAAPGVTEKPLRQPRPGHADLVGMQKYGFDDARNVLERASARETAARVAAGALAKQLLADLGTSVLSHVVAARAGARRRRTPGRSPTTSTAVDDSQVRCFDPDAEAAMVAAIEDAAKAGDSLGGVVEVLGYGVPPGLGSHVHWDRRIDGLLAQALMSIQAMKAVEIGEGFDVAGRPGSEAHDEITWGEDAGGYERGSDARRGHRGRDDDRRPAGGAGLDEAAVDAEPAGAAHRRRRDQGGDGLLQGAHRRHRGAGVGRRGGDDGRARARGRGAAQVRRRLDRVSSTRNHAAYSSHCSRWTT